MKRNYLLVTVALCGTFSLIYGQEKKDSVSAKYIDEVILTAMKQIKTDSLSGNLKRNDRLLEIPQNIVSIKSDLLNLQGAFDVQDILRNVSGIYISDATGAGNIFSGTFNAQIRGFNPVSTFRNGLPSFAGGLSQEDVALIEQVDVIKGPAGFINSMGSGGGSLNINTKTPRRIREVNITAGSFDFYRASVDLGSAVKEKGLSFRLNAAYESQGYYSDYAKRRKFIIAPVVQYNFSKNTFLLAEWNMIQGRALESSNFIQYESENMVQKHPWRANYQGDPNLPVSKLDEHYGRLVFNHNFNDKWKIVSQSSIKSTPLDQWSLLGGTTSYNPPMFDEAGNALRSSFRNKQKYLTYNTQIFLNGSYNMTKDIVHTILTGFDFNSSKSTTEHIQGANEFIFNRSQMNYGINRDLLIQPEADDQIDYTKSKDVTIGAYVYNNFKLWDRVIIDAGFRYSRNKRNRYLKGPSSPEGDNKIYRHYAVSPRVGITYLIEKDFAAFFSYDQSFEPMPGTDPQGKEWKPMETYNTEFGLKKDWFGGLLSTSVSAYRIIRNNTFSQNPANGVMTQLNQVRNKGIEVDIIGSIYPNITLTANYSYINSVYSKDPYAPELVGKRFSSVPRHQINTWFMYKFQKGKLQGLSLAIGQTAALLRETDVAGVRIPDFIKLDASIMYQHKKWFVRGIFDNLANRRYITDGNVTDRYNADWSSVIGQNWMYKESNPFNFKLQVGIKF
ncbi:TonB-dependent siderophore receptor [Elizabethkingia ursingii]|uniref:TonB-dependent siderophore receptor n=1 Tax=Elizabethkingia ursingii TaxID=1756150 RepID=UPI0020113CD5|nr:TonB-dependent siderophore receptor [Elizabethkingia ursingii]MCL1666067.1 TonB-dependent siderophore receptor [Elizabethkingia ursingii]